MSEPQLVIKEAVKEDVIALSYLMQELGYETSLEEMQVRFDHIHNHIDYKTFIAWLDKKVVGMAGTTQNYFYEQNGKYVRVLALIVNHSYRHRGIGKILLEAVENWAIEIGATSVLLNCGNRDERKQAHEFYNSRGYEVKSSGYIKKLLCPK